MNGAEAVLTSLKNEGVDVVFGYPGGAVLTLYDAVYKMKFPHILTRHEQGAVHAADGYARATGKVGVVFATSGPGATNLVTGISTAYTDSVPLVCITGQVANSYIGKDSFQEADVCGITTPITKHNYLVKKVEDLPRVLKEAFYIARTGRPGPVVVDVAKDVFDTKLDYAYPESVHLRGYSGENIGDEREIDAVVEAIRAAKKPLVFAGGGVILSETADVLQDIVRRLGAPSTATLLGLGAIPADEKGFLSFAGMHGSYGANMAIQECDLLLCVGMRFSDRVTGKVSEFAPHAKIVHFEIDRAELNKNVAADYRVLGDLSWSLPILRDKLAAPPDCLPRCAELARLLVSASGSTVLKGVPTAGRIAALGDLSQASAGETIDCTRLIQPKVEGEIAFVLGRDLPHPDTTLGELLRAVDHVLPALEIVDSAIEDWKKNGS